MRFNLAHHSVLAALLALGSTFAAGCSLAGDAGVEEPVAPAETDGTSSEPIVDIDNSSAKRQSIGNCWLYATASWAESLAKQVPGAAERNISESYWTYWHWFDQIAIGKATSEMPTGGHYKTAVEIIARYGIVEEGAFIASEATDEKSYRQSAALKKINTSLKTGALSTPAARRDRALVRRELDTAWGLSANVVAQLTRVFGTGVNRTLNSTNTAGTLSTSIQRAADIRVRLRDPDTKALVTGTLQDAIGAPTHGASRSGRYAWNTVSYPTKATERRAMLGRVQKAMHAAQPVIMSWYVDFNALDSSGRFAAPPATPGLQGGHMVVVEDYQINNVPGFGTLAAGVNERRPAALEAALSPAAKIEFFRVKNSWGTYQDRPFVAAGYHDLYMNYLDGPIKACTQNADGTGSTSKCWNDTPLNDLVLPAGY